MKGKISLPSTRINDAFIPEYCMKINEKFKKYLTTTGCYNLRNKE